MVLREEERVATRSRWPVVAEPGPGDGRGGEKGAGSELSARLRLRARGFHGQDEFRGGGGIRKERVSKTHVAMRY